MADRTLLIEDDPGAQLLYRNRLQDLGHEVVVASNGAQGLMEAAAGSFDLFLVDIGLGSGIDGFEVCRRLKAKPQLNGIPVVLISGEVKNREELHTGYEVGCEAFLVKGDLILLEDVVRAMLRMKSLYDDLGLQNRLLEEQNKRLQQERERAADLEEALRTSGSRGSLVRELASGRPDAVLVVDTEGVVRAADRGGRDVFGRKIEGEHLAKLAPATGLEAFVRDARSEGREGGRFEIRGRGSRGNRALTAMVVPMVPQSGVSEPPLKVVFLSDAKRRRVAAEMLRLEDQGVPRKELGPLLEVARQHYHPGRILGESAAAGQLRRDVMRACATESPVLIRGESGSGKDMIARTLHFSGSTNGPFVPVNCQAISAGPLESELFGHVKGAFPDALADRPGLFQQANHGTICLHEIADVPLETQAKILRAISDGEVYRVGSQQPELVDVRVIASTKVNLEERVKEKLFNKDLFYRINVVDLHIAPLRERREDITPIANDLLRCYGIEREGMEFSEQALEVMGRHDWLGNIRELESCVERACAMAKSEVIEYTDLPQVLVELGNRLFEDRSITPVAPGKGRAKQSTGGASRSANPAPWDEVIDPESEPVSLGWYEKQALLRALRETGGDKLAAAKKLGIGKSTFYRKLNQYGV